MKKLLLTILTILTALGIKAQQVDSIVVTPAMPDANDPITIYAYLSFPQGNCADVATVFISGNDIYGYGFHCMGNAMFMCYDVDTINLAPLTAGNYNLYFTLDAGFGPPGNCSPGFLPYDVDTYLLAVSTVLEVPDQNTGTVSVYPNPVSEQLTIGFSGGTIADVQLMNVLGEEVLSVRPNSASAEIPVAGLAEGLYFCRVTDAAGNMHLQQFQIMR